jgi:hypothetical protein
MRNSIVSQARAEANRANAKRSTGPRTTEGKARVSKNALRHGLSAAQPDADSVSAEVLGLAGRLCGRAQAGFAGLNAAEAELTLVRIRRIKQRVLEAMVRRVENETVQNQLLGADEVMARALIECADELLKLDGYERKARSRRNKAFRSLYE